MRFSSTFKNMQIYYEILVTGQLWVFNYFLGADFELVPFNRWMSKSQRMTNMSLPTVINQVTFWSKCFHDSQKYSLDLVENPDRLGEVPILYQLSHINLCTLEEINSLLKPFYKSNKTNSGSRVCSNYILIFREWKRLIDRLTDKNTARWIDR